MKEFGKVGVLMGGQSAEREISLMSGEGVLRALKSRGVDAHKVDVENDIVEVLQQEKFDRVFNILHGPMGEDGTVQGLLEFLNIPYTGAGVLGSAIAMDKARCKLIWQAMGLPTPKFVVLDLANDIEAQIKHLKLPLAIKPVFEGSSVGATKLTDLNNLQEAIESAELYGDILVEEWIEGPEFTIGIVGDTILPSIKIAVPLGFYDYDQKYFVDTTVYSCPSGLSEKEEMQMGLLAKNAYDAVACEGWGRIDIMQDKLGQFYLLENNTTPGMTSSSLVPKAAKVIGWSYEDLVIEVLKQTL